jgi:transposase
MGYYCGDMFFRTKKSGPREYLQIVKNWREEGKVRQEVVATVGRLDELKRTGALDNLLRSGIKYSEKLALLDGYERGATPPARDTKVGIPLIFGRLWEATGLRSVLSGLLGQRQFQFPVERAIFLTVLHRLTETGSDRSAEEWQKEYRIEGAGAISLHHLYRAMAWLGEKLPEEEQDFATPFSPRCTKDLVEEKLFEQKRDLFADLTLAFFDTTSIYFEGEGADLGERGNSKDHRPDLKQMVIGVVLDSDGRPLCSEMWPGNTADVTTLLPLTRRLQMRFGIGRLCIVADRGMISNDVIRTFHEKKIEYILGVRMRNQKEVRNEAVSRPGRYHEIPPEKKHNPLKVKEVILKGKRYIVCCNEEQAKKDARAREAILASLEEKLSKGAKSLIGNKGYRKYIRMERETVTIDRDKIVREARYDGKWVLTTNTSLRADQVALQYKQLWMVEQAFRTIKSVLATRPIFHKRNETIRGHVFCSFLALVLMKELQDRLGKKGWKLEWDRLVRDLDHLKEMEIVTAGKEVIIRNELRGDTATVFRAAGVVIPPTVRIVPQEDAAS